LSEHDRCLAGRQSFQNAKYEDFPVVRGQCRKRGPHLVASFQSPQTGAGTGMAVEQTIRKRQC